MEIQDGGKGTEAENLSSMTPETSLRYWSYTWVILIASSENNNHHHIRCRKKVRLALKSAFNCN
jgi:hypothetical protein